MFFIQRIQYLEQIKHHQCKQRDTDWWILCLLVQSAETVVSRARTSPVQTHWALLGRKLGPEWEHPFDRDQTFTVNTGEESWDYKNKTKIFGNEYIYIMEKAREFQKNIYFCLIDHAKDFDCVDHNKLWKILKEMGIPDHLTCLLRNLYASIQIASGVSLSQEPQEWSR